ncbi:MAG: KpsF/GutQ family sugar-phosphate isomerase [Bacteroidetes bacterium]|nr:MAG: KpsF/GutQ family sugar-phosphate isomerase [Bacteroidota bacterium]
MRKEQVIAAAQRVFQVEQQSLAEASARLDDQFAEAVEKVLAMKGKLVVCGMGKSGHIGKKIAATLASTGTPSFFVHPGEAFHGDLGMIGSDDVVLLISYSGETDEVLRIIPFLQNNGNVLIGMSGKAESTLAKEVNYHLHIGVSKEACPLELAPTSSTTVTLAMGDALAVALMEAREFQPEDFARFHPGGSLGRRLLHKVRDYMVTEELPFIQENAGGQELVLKLSEGRLGLVIVLDQAGKLLGVISDGDLRRAMEKTDRISDLKVIDLVSRNPIQVASSLPIHEAEKLMLERKVLSVLVTENDKVLGVCQLYSIYGGR